MESIECISQNNTLNLVYIDNKEISLFLHFHIYQLIFSLQPLHNIFLFNSKSILSDLHTCSSFSNLAKQFSILSKSFPFIFLFLQLVQFSIIFIVSSNSFDSSVVLTLKSFSF